MNTKQQPADVKADLPDLTPPQKEMFPVETHNIYVPQAGDRTIRKRRYAIVEHPAYFTLQPEQQLMLMTERELEATRREFPGLVVRWAENEDLAKWKVTASVFDQEVEHG